MAGQQIKITIRRVAQESVTLAYDEARGIFGIGGTPDEELPHVLADLLTARPPERIMRLLRTAGVDVELDRDLSVELTGLVNPADGCQFYPEPGNTAPPPGPALPAIGRRAAVSPAEQIAGPEGHVCLGCGCRIAEGLREIAVPGRRHGVRYRHAGSDDCANALRAPQPNNSLIGRYEALPGFRWDPARRGPRPGRTAPASGPGRPRRPAPQPCD